MFCWEGLAYGLTLDDFDSRVKCTFYILRFGMLTSRKSSVEVGQIV